MDLRSWSSKITLMLMLFSAVTTSQTLTAQDGSEDPTHAELRVLRDEVITAFNKRDFDALVSHMHADVVVTWQNGEVVKGRSELLAYFKKMLEGPEKVVEDIKINPEVAELTVLHGGDSGVAWGTSDDQYVLTNGMDFKVKGHWSTNLVKENGKWMVAAYHGSINAFDNPIIDGIKATYKWLMAGMLLLGVIFGAVVMRMMSTK